MVRLFTKVLVVEPEKRRLLLTAKKSFLHTKLPTVTSYSDCQRGMVLEGFIASVKPNGVLVIFYNNVKVRYVVWLKVACDSKFQWHDTNCLCVYVFTGLGAKARTER